MDKSVLDYLKNPNVMEDLAKFGFTTRVLDISEISSTLYNDKGRLFFITLPESKIVLKKQKNSIIEASNLQRKKNHFQKNYPQVYSYNDSSLLLEFIDETNAWDKVISGDPIPLELMVTHLAEVHNISITQLKNGEIDFRPKVYADYCKSKFDRHLGGILELNFEQAYSDLRDKVEDRLKKYPPVEHIDANLHNWFGLIKIDETNNTLSVPHLTLKSMLQYGPLDLNDDQVEKLYQKYCDIRELDIDEFMAYDSYADLIFN